MEKESIIAEILHMKRHYNDIDSRYIESISKINKHDAIVRESLKDNEELLNHYLAVVDGLDEYEETTAEISYTAGVKFGFKLAMEIFDIYTTTPPIK